MKLQKTPSKMGKTKQNNKKIKMLIGKNIIYR
jgi:hypothetical protein